MEKLIEIKNLRVKFRTDVGIVSAVNGVSYDIFTGKTIGLVGESGCGKSVSANAIMQILPENGWIDGGEVLYHGKDGVFDIAKLGKKDKKIQLLHGKEIAMIFQEPMTSFCPVYTIGNQIIEAVRLHTDIPKKEQRNYAIELLRKVQMSKPEQRIDEYPYQLSGGMRQRAMIAMAIAANPRLLIADEPTTSLDVTVQAQILNLLLELQQEKGMSILMINHNMGVIAETSDVIAVMYLGKIVEIAPSTELLNNPMHPYTQDLFASIPKITDDPGGKLSYIEGNVPDAYSIPAGCNYHTRCRRAIAGLCDIVCPEEKNISENHRVACHRCNESETKHGQECSN